ncbi:MAG: GspH/FimT family pseudopilin [Gammaproteobacteria bacterium]|nr:GspH/FimT family pseudopilin [Gammaproteobacteria bacterium]
MRCTLSQGLTLIELVLTLAVLAVLAVSAAPSLLDLLDRHRLRGAAENLRGDLMLARAEALRLNTTVSVAFSIDSVNSRWCYGLSDSGTCDCQSNGACLVAGAPAHGASTERFRRIGLTTNLHLGTATFQPARGTANAGTVTLSAGASEVDVVLSALGRVRLCSDTLGAYPPC